MKEESRRKETLLSLLKKSLFDYFANTTVHGFAYLASSDIRLFEKVFWALVNKEYFETLATVECRFLARRSSLPVCPLRATLSMRPSLTGRSIRPPSRS